jgi:ribosome-binding factor A
MTSRRAQKLAEAVREVVGMAILAEIKDPRVQGVTVTRVEMSGDLRYAKVHVSVMGNDTQQNLTLRGLQSAAGFLQSKIAKRIETRYTPRLEFHLDLGVKKSIEVARILREVLPPEPPLPDEDEPDEDEPAEDETAASEATADATTVEEDAMPEGDHPTAEASESNDVSHVGGDAPRIAKPPDGAPPAT